MLAWYTTQYPNKAKNEKGITKEKFDEIPICSNISRINFDDGITRDHVRPLNEMIPTNKHCALALITAPGVGKTKASKEYMQQLPGNVPVLVPSFRISLSEKQKADFAGLNFKHYQDPEFDKTPIIKLSEVYRLIIQVDSIYRVIHHVENGILLLDEW